MIERTLFALGDKLSEIFGINKNEQLIYDDPEHIYQYLEENQGADIKYKFPLVAYYATSFSDPSVFRPFSNKHGKSTDAAFNVNTTAKKTTTFVPIDVSITIGIFAQTFESYLEAIKNYFKLGLLRTFRVETSDDYLDGYFLSVLDDVTSLSTPPAGLNTRDVDTMGKIYSIDGDFRINTYMCYYEEFVMIRKTNVTRNELPVGGQHGRTS